MLLTEGGGKSDGRSARWKPRVRQSLTSLLVKRITVRVSEFQEILQAIDESIGAVQVSV